MPYGNMVHIVDNKDSKVDKAGTEIFQSSHYFEDEFYLPQFDEFGKPYPPPEAVYDYYDETYYYELVETKPIDAYSLVEPELYVERQKRKQLINELTNLINY